jgi:hypothetical protein
MRVCARDRQRHCGTVTESMQVHAVCVGPGLCHSHQALASSHHGKQATAGEAAHASRQSSAAQLHPTPPHPTALHQTAPHSTTQHPSPPAPCSASHLVGAHPARPLRAILHIHPQAGRQLGGHGASKLCDVAVAGVGGLRQAEPGVCAHLQGGGGRSRSEKLCETNREAGTVQPLTTVLLFTCLMACGVLF